MRLRRAKLGERFQEDERPEDDPVTNTDWATSADREVLLARLGRIGALEIIGWLDVACIDKDNGDRSNHSCRVIMKLFELEFSEGDVLALMLEPSAPSATRARSTCATISRA
jgi:hypothetical protein